VNVEIVGTRAGVIRYLPAERKSRSFYEEQVALLRRLKEDYERSMERTFAAVRARSLRSPPYGDRRGALQGLATLEALTASGLYTSSSLLPLAADEPVAWDRYVVDEPIVVASLTSGTSGLNKIMPYSQRAIDASAAQTGPFLAQMALDHGQSDHPRILALSAPEDYVTWQVMPALARGLGYDVVHAPFSTIMNVPGAAEDLVEYLLGEAGSIDAIITVGPMLPHLLKRLEGCPGGEAAVARLAHDLRFVISGGTQVTPALAATLRARLGLRGHGIMEVFASTEGGIILGSVFETGIFHPCLHTHAVSLIPLGELERAAEEPGFTPRAHLVTRAPVGTVGELVFSLDQSIPLLNFRTGDLFEVASATGDYFTVPSLQLRADHAVLHDIGAAKVWPQEYHEAVRSLGDRVTDYIAMSLKAHEVSTSEVAKDRLVFLHEGTASPAEVESALLRYLPILHDVARDLGLADVLVVHLRGGSLAKYRLRKSAARRGAPGPLKHRILKGPEYTAEAADVLESRLYPSP
jgi:hypothetical protein